MLRLIKAAAVTGAATLFIPAAAFAMDPPPTTPGGSGGGSSSGAHGSGGGSPASVPEPADFALFAMGMAGLYFSRRAARSRKSRRDQD